MLSLFIHSIYFPPVDVITCRTLSASRRGWMKWRPGPHSRYLSDSLLSLSHKSAFLFRALDSSEPQKPPKRPQSRRWRLVAVTRKTGVINASPSGGDIDRHAPRLTRCMSRWPDKHSTGTWTAACLVRCGMRAKRRNDWMTPARAEPMVRPLCPSSVGKPPHPHPPPSPSSAPESQYSIAWLRCFIV